MALGLTTMIALFTYAILCGIAAAVYHAILIAPGHILSGWRLPIERAVNHIGERSNYGRIYGVVRSITTSLVDCSWCMAGQLGLFVYLWYGGRDVVQAVLFTCLSIMACVVAFQYLNNGKK